MTTLFKTLRQEKGLTLQQLADQAGAKSRQYIHNLENGENALKDDQIGRNIAATLGADFEKLQSATLAENLKTGIKRLENLTTDQLENVDDQRVKSFLEKTIELCNDPDFQEGFGEKNTNNLAKQAARVAEAFTAKKDRENKAIKQRFKNLGRDNMGRRREPENDQRFRDGLGRRREHKEVKRDGTGRVIKE